jgi:uncharacterized MAPEG superfamily protein
MTFELRVLALSVVLGLAQIVLASHAASLQRGYLWTAGSRDEAVPPLTGMASRLERALRNFVETFPLFAAAVLIAHVTHTHSWMTEWGVQLYFGARVAYLALVCGGCISLALTRVERGDPRDRAGALVTRLNHASAVEHAARPVGLCPKWALGCRSGMQLSRRVLKGKRTIRGHWNFDAVDPTRICPDGLWRPSMYLNVSKASLIPPRITICRDRGGPRGRPLPHHRAYGSVTAVRWVRTPVRRRLWR